MLNWEFNINLGYRWLSTTSDAVAFRQHANGSKSEPHKVFRSLQSHVASSTLSVQSDDEDQSSCSLEGIEARRLSLIAASENLKNVVAESNFREDQGENHDGSDCSSLSMISNVYWNALYSSKSCEDHDQIFGALDQGVIS